MAHSNGKIYVDTSTTPNTGVSVADVKETTGLSSNDVATLCTSSHVNKWSKKKPVPISSISHGETLTDSRYSLSGGVSTTENPWYLGNLVSLSSNTSLGPRTIQILNNTRSVTLYPIAGLWVPVMTWNGDAVYITNAIDEMNTTSSTLNTQAWSRVDWGVFDSTTRVNSYGLPSRLQDFNGYDHNAEYENGVWCEDTIYSGQTIPIWIWGSMTLGRDSLSLADIGKAFANDFKLGIILKDTNDNCYTFFTDGEGSDYSLKDLDNDICFRINPSDLPSSYVGQTWKVYYVARFTNAGGVHYILMPATTAHPNPVEFFVSNQSAVNPFSNDGVHINTFYHIPYPNFTGHWVEQSYNGTTNENLYVGIGTYGQYCVAIEYTNSSSSSVTIDFSNVSFYWSYCGNRASQVQNKGGKEDYDLYLKTGLGTSTRLTDLSITWNAGETKTLIFDFGQQNANGTKDDSSTSVFTALNGTTYDLTQLESAASQAGGFFDLESEMLICYRNNDVDSFIDSFTVHALYISATSGYRNSRQKLILEEDGTVYNQ